MLVSVLLTLIYICLFAITIYLYLNTVIVIGRIEKHKYAIANSKRIIKIHHKSLYWGKDIDQLTNHYFNYFVSNEKNYFLSLPIHLIFDGEIVFENLWAIKKDLSWLSSRLQDKGIDNLDSVDHAYIDTSGYLNFSIYSK